VVRPVHRATVRCAAPPGATILPRLLTGGAHCSLSPSHHRPHAAAPWPVGAHPRARRLLRRARAGGNAPVTAVTVAGIRQACRGAPQPRNRAPPATAAPSPTATPRAYATGDPRAPYARGAVRAAAAAPAQLGIQCFLVAAHNVPVGASPLGRRTNRSSPSRSTGSPPGAALGTPGNAALDGKLDKTGIGPVIFRESAPSQAPRPTPPHPPWCRPGRERLRHRGAIAGVLARGAAYDRPGGSGAGRGRQTVGTVRRYHGSRTGGSPPRAGCLAPRRPDTRPPPTPPWSARAWHARQGGGTLGASRATAGGGPRDVRRREVAACPWNGAAWSAVSGRRTGVVWRRGAARGGPLPPMGCPGAALGTCLVHAPASRSARGRHGVHRGGPG